MPVDSPVISKVVRVLIFSLWISFGVVVPPVEAEPLDQAAAVVGALTDPDMLDRLHGEREATPRLRRVMYWLWVAQAEGRDPGGLIDAAQQANGSEGTERGKLLRESLLRNLDILEKLGCLDAAGTGKLRTGNAPTVAKGPYAGELATVDHIIPRSIAPELDNVLINLEFLPETLNRAKGNKVGDRQVQLARKWQRAGVLSREGLESVEAAWEVSRQGRDSKPEESK